MNKPWIPEISVAHVDDLFATVDTNAIVNVWSLRDRRRLSSFKSLWSLGGQRLHLIDSPKPLVITSSWTRGKSAAYAALTGENVWTVSISHVQRIATIAYLGCEQLGFGTDDRGLQIRDSLTGAYLRNVAGIRKFFQSRHGCNCLLVSRKKRLVFCAAADGARLGESFLLTFAVLDAAYSGNQVLISEAAGPVRCFELDGNELWRLHPVEERHAVRVCWSNSLGKWIGAVLKLEGSDTSTTTVAIVDETGISELFTFPTRFSEFAADGSIVIGGDGCVRSIPSGEIVWRFAD